MSTCLKSLTCVAYQYCTFAIDTCITEQQPGGPCSDVGRRPTCGGCGPSLMGGRWGGRLGQHKAPLRWASTMSVRTGRVLMTRRLHAPLVPPLPHSSPPSPALRPQPLTQSLYLTWRGFKCLAVAVFVRSDLNRRRLTRVSVVLKFLVFTRWWPSPVIPAGNNCAASRMSRSVAVFIYLIYERNIIRRFSYISLQTTLGKNYVLRTLRLFLRLMRVVNDVI